MTFIEIIDAFTLYGADVVLLAVLTSLTTQLLKKTVFKKVEKKFLTFLPFALGVLFYAAYAAIVNLSLKYLIDEFATVLSDGLAVGAVATFLYVLYEQFIRGGGAFTPSQSVTASLISPYVPEESLQEAATAAEEAATAEDDGERTAEERVEEALLKYAAESAGSAEIKSLAKIIVLLLNAVRPE